MERDVSKELKGETKVEGTAGLTCMNGKTVSPVKYVVNKSASSFAWTFFDNVSHVLFGEDVKPETAVNWKLQGSYWHVLVPCMTVTDVNVVVIRKGAVATSNATYFPWIQREVVLLLANLPCEVLHRLEFQEIVSLIV